MSTKNIIENYKASDVLVPKNMIGWMRSNHAGETGAVWIYIGAQFVFWNRSIIKMAKEHCITEQNHLIVMQHLVPKNQRSKLIVLWRILGLGLGFISAILGYRFFCTTIEAVETFVEEHYKEQIEFLYKNSSAYPLLEVLNICCNEEIEHQLEAKVSKGNNNFKFEKFWFTFVGKSSGLAVNISRYI
jgi:ubiquinone biosynthesis monooxygenase Coq7